MKIFVLKPNPKEKDNKKWQNSIYPHPIVVRSESELLARSLAADLLMPKTSGALNSQQSPWASKSIVDCEIYQGDLYELEGKPQLLYPVESSLKQS